MRWAQGAMLLLPGESLSVNIPAPYPRAVSSLRRLVDGLQRRSTLSKGFLLYLSSEQPCPRRLARWLLAEGAAFPRLHFPLSGLAGQLPLGWPCCLAPLRRSKSLHTCGERVKCSKGTGKKKNALSQASGYQEVSQ